jgi:XTP/dITP diphosphohydrolase
VTQIYACSTNAGKLREFGLVASELGLTEFDLHPLPRLKEIEAPDETGSTFEENAAQKAIYYSQFTDKMVLADDSGIEVDALHGAPGVYSARYAGEGASGRQNNELLLEKMQGQTNRGARFVCAISLARTGRVLHTVRGTVQGILLHAPQGSNGFGYDPLFFYPSFDCSFGELDDTRKFAVSHRGDALRKTFAWLRLCQH